MSQPAGVEPTQGGDQVTDPSTGGTPTPEVTQNNDPPYMAQLNELPESVRPLVEPIFKKWDTDVAERFQKVHSEYEPWKPVITQFDPESVQQAVALAQYLEQNPRELYDRIAEAYGYNTTEQGQPGAQPTGQPDPNATADPDAIDDPNAEKLGQLEQAVIALAQHLQNQQQTTEQQSNIQLLNQTLEGLKTSHGDFNEQYVLTMIANGADPEAAVLSWKAELQKALQTSTSANDEAPPVVSGSGSGVPSTQEDITKLDDKQTKDLVVTLLQQANQS